MSSLTVPARNPLRSLRMSCLAALMLLCGEGVAGQATEHLIEIDLSKAKKAHAIADVDGPELVRVQVININPFAGRYTIHVPPAEEVAQAPSALASIAGTLGGLLAPSAGGSALLARMLAVLGNAAGGGGGGDQAETSSDPGEPPPSAEESSACSLKAQLDSLEAGLNSANERIAVSLPRADRLRRGREHIEVTWDELREMHGEKSAIQLKAGELQEALRVYLNTAMLVADSVLVQAGSLRLLAARTMAMAEAANKEEACATEHAKFVRALQEQARAEVLVAMIEAQAAEAEALGTLHDAIREVGPRDYEGTALVPFQSRAGLVDVSVVMTGWEDGEEVEPQVVASRRLRFTQGWGSGVRIGLGVYGSTIPFVTYRVREVPVAGVSEAGYEVATDRRQEGRLILALMTELPLNRFLGLVLGAGPHVDDLARPNALAGLSFRFGAFSLGFTGTAAFGDRLEDPLKVGSPLPSASALATRKDVFLGLAFGLNWIPR